MADYSENYEKIRALGADVVAVSVDAPETAESMRRELQLPFAVLCDTERRVIQDWDIYNPREAGGIPKPSLFVIGRDRVVRHFSPDGIAARVPASEAMRLLQSTGEVPEVRRKIYIPTPAEMFRAVRHVVEGLLGRRNSRA